MEYKANGGPEQGQQARIMGADVPRYGNLRHAAEGFGHYGLDATG